MIYVNSKVTPGLWFVFMLSLCMNLSSTHVSGQLQGQSKIDSLLNKLPTLSDDTNKAKLLNTISYEYPYINPDEGIKYGRLSLALAEKLKWKEGIAKANSSIGSNYETKADYAHALQFEYQALKIHEASGDKPNQALMLGNIGIIYHTQGDQVKAMEYDSLSLNMYRELRDKQGTARLLGNIANIYSTLHNYSKTLEYDLAAHAIIEEIGDKNLLANNLGNIGNVYADQGNSSKAMEYYFKTLALENEIGDKSGIVRNMGNIGETYLDIANDTTGSIKPDSLIPSGRTANLHKAIEYLTNTIDSSKKIDHPQYIVAFSESLTEAYALSGDFKNALQTYRNYITVRDSIYNLKKNSDFARLQLDYEYGKRDEALKYQKMRAQFFYITGIVVLLILSASIYRNFRVQKKSNAVITLEKIRSENLLLNILPSEVAEELKDKGTAAAKHFNNVTVLFTDFVSFTKVAETLTPQELIDELHTCFKEFDAIIDRHNIEKIKTIGDAYLAVGGLPIEIPGHAEKVIAAAIEIINFMQKRKLLHGDKTFEVRIGIHSGSVVAGIVGVKKFAYDIWGDTVNVAARMEQNSEPNHINISQTTYEFVKDKFKCTYRGEIEAKNKGKLSMYFVDTQEKAN